jgi:hypothetical protein
MLILTEIAPSLAYYLISQNKKGRNGRERARVCLSVCCVCFFLYYEYIKINEEMTKHE